MSNGTSQALVTGPFPAAIAAVSLDWSCTINFLQINLEFDRNRITLEPEKRSDRPRICGLSITVYDVLSMLSSGMTQQEIQDDFPELSPEDIFAIRAYAADRDHPVVSLRAQ